MPTWIESLDSCFMITSWALGMVLETPGPSSLGAKWFRYRVSIHHPLGFKDGTRLEGAGMISRFREGA